MKTLKTQKKELPGIARKMSGYKALNPALVMNFLESYGLYFLKKGRFAELSIRPEIYPVAPEEIRAMHGRKGFVFKTRLVDRTSGEPEAQVLFYEPFAEEAIVLPAKVLKLKKFGTWLKPGRKQFLIETVEGVELRRIFKVCGSSLKAERDCVSCGDQAGIHFVWKYFPPMHFVYKEVPYASEILD